MLVSGVHKRVVFQKGGFGGCSPGTKTGTRVHSDVPPERKPERGYVRLFPLNESRNEGAFAKTTLLRNRPFVSQKAREGCGCPKFVAGKVFWQISTLLENYSLIFQQLDMLSLPRFGRFLARKMAAGQSARLRERCWIFSSETATAFFIEIWPRAIYLC